MNSYLATTGFCNSTFASQDLIFLILPVGFPLSSSFTCSSRLSFQGHKMTVVFTYLILLHHPGEETFSPVAAIGEKESSSFSEGLTTYLLTLTGYSWFVCSFLIH